MTDTFTLPPVSMPSPGSIPEPVGQTVSTGEVVGRMFTSETGIGAGAKLIFAPSAREGFSREFNSWDYIKTLPEEDQQLAFEHAEKMGLLVSPEAVNNRLAGLKDELRTSTVLSKASTGQFLLGVGATFFDLSTLVPIGGILGKVGTGTNAVLRYAAVGGAMSALDEAAIQAATETRDYKTSLLNIGIGTAVGGGLGAFARLYNTPERAARSQKAFTEKAEERIFTPEDGSMGAAYDPKAAERGSVDSLVEPYDIKGIFLDPVIEGLSTVTTGTWRSPAQFIRRYGMKKNMKVVQRFVQTLVDVEGAVDDTIRPASLQMTKQKMWSLGRLIEQDYRRAFSQMSAELGGSPHQFGLKGILSRPINGRPPVDEETFGVIVDLKLRNRNYKYAESDIIDRYAEQAAERYRPVFREFLRRSSDAGLQRTNKVRKLEARMKNLEAKMAEKERLTRETPTGRKRRQDTKAAAEARVKYERAKKRYERSIKELEDLEDYLPQVWLKRAIRAGDREKFIDILKRNFMRAASRPGAAVLDEEMIRASYRARGESLSDDQVDEIMDLYETGGIQALDPKLVASIMDDLEGNARYSAEQVHRSFRKIRGREHEASEIDPEFSSRFKGRQIDLDEEAFKEMVEEGFLLGDPNVILHQYMRDVGSKTLMKERFGTVDPINDDEVGFVRAMLDEIEQADLRPGEVEQVQEYLQALTDRFLGFTDYMGGEVGRYFVRNATRYTGSVLTGTAGITALSDLSGQILTQGLGSTVASMFSPTLGRALKSMEGHQDLAKMVLIGDDIALGAIRARAWIGDQPVSRLALERGVGTGWARSISGGVDKFTEASYSLTQYLNGNQMLTTWFRAQGGVWLLRKLATGDIDDKLMNHMGNLGLSKADIEKLKAGPKFNAGEHRGFDMDLVDLNELAKTDRMLADKMEMALDRNARIMSVKIGDGTLPPIFDKPMAKLLLQFGQYMSGMTENVFRNKLKYGLLPNDAAGAINVAGLLGIGIMIDQLKTIARGQPMNLDEKFETPERTLGTIYDSMDRIGFLGLLSPYSKFLVQFGANSADVDLFGNSGRYRDVDLMGLMIGPSYAIGERFQSMLSSTQAGEMDSAGYHALRLMPFSTTAFMAPLVQAARPQ